MLLIWGVKMDNDTMFHLQALQIAIKNQELEIKKLQFEIDTLKSMFRVVE